MDFDMNNVSVKRLKSSSLQGKAKQYMAIGKSAENFNQCTNLVKNTLETHARDMLDGTNVGNIGGRIGQILDAQYTWGDSSGDFDNACCKGGTEYDHFLLDQVQGIDRATFLESVDAKTT